MLHAQRSSRCMLLLLALLSAAACLASSTPHTRHTHQQQQPPPTLSWAVQLSDVHISTNKAPNIQDDLVVFGALLGALAPAALLVSGDMVDAKLPGAVGTKQYWREWLAYRRLWLHLAAAAGLPPTAVLDLRGNHDVFNTWRNVPPGAVPGADAAALNIPGWLPRQGRPASATFSKQTGSSSSSSRSHQGGWPRGGATARSMLDPFATWSAAADAGGGDAAARRVTTHYLWPQLLLEDTPPGTAPSAESQEPHQQQQEEQQQAQEGWKPGTAEAAARAQLRGRGLAVKRGAWQQLFRQQPFTDAAAAAEGVALRLQQRVCPAAALVGFDVTPRLGLHGLGDFFGVVTQQLVSDLNSALQQVRAPNTTTTAAAGGVTRGKLHILPPGSSSSSSSSSIGTGQSPKEASTAGACGASIPIISYSHQPTSMNYISQAPAHTGITAATGGRSLPASSSRSGGSRRRGQGPAPLRCRSRWCGGAGAVIRGLLAQWDVSWVLVGHLHTLPGDKMHRVTPKVPVAVTDQDGTYLAELELGDWKDSRRWRLVVADAGTLTFADFTFIVNTRQLPMDWAQQELLYGGFWLDESDSKGRQLLHAAMPLPTVAAAMRRQGAQTAVPTEAAAARAAWVASKPYALQGVDVSRVVADRVVLLTWPPDARYSPLSQTELLRWQRDGGWQARILVLPAYPDGVALGTSFSAKGQQAASRHIQSAAIAWRCVTNWGSSDTHSSGSIQLQQVVVQRLKPESPVTATYQQQYNNSGNSGKGQQGGSGATGTAAAAEAASVFASSLAADSSLVACQAAGRLLLLQAVVTTVPDGGAAAEALVSSSELRPVMLRPLTAAAAGKRFDSAGAAAGSGPALIPLQLTVLEHMALVWDWPLVLYIAFHLVWACNMLLLVGPWVYHKYGFQIQRSLGRLQSTGTLGAASSSSTMPPAAAAAAAAGAAWPRWSYTTTQGYRAASNSGYSGTNSGLSTLNRRQQGDGMGMTAWFTAGIYQGWLHLWQYGLQPPLIWLLVLAQHRPLWWANLCYSTWLLLGPWAVVVKLTSYTHGLSLLTSYGYIAALPTPVARQAGQVYYDDTAAAGQSAWQWQYQLLPCPDLGIDLLPFMVLGVVPLTLWLGWVLAAWSGTPCSRVTAASSNCSTSPPAAGMAVAAAQPNCGACATLVGQALLLVPVLAALYRMCKRVWGHYGLITLLSSPVVVWWPGLLLVLLFKQLAQRAGGGMSVAAVPRCPSCASLSGDSRAGACKERSE